MSGKRGRPSTQNTALSPSLIPPRHLGLLQLLPNPTPSFLSSPLLPSVLRALCFSRSKWPYTAYQSPTLLTIAPRWTHLRQGGFASLASIITKGMDGWMAVALTLADQTDVQTLQTGKRSPLSLRLSE